jgi:hypothetical protein
MAAADALALLTALQPSFEGIGNSSSPRSCNRSFMNSLGVMVALARFFFFGNKKKPAGTRSGEWEGGAINWTSLFARYSPISFAEWSGALSQCRNYSLDWKLSLFFLSCLRNSCRTLTM